MQKEIKIFEDQNIRIFFSINQKQSGIYDFRFDFGSFSFIVNYNKWNKKAYTTDYLHNTLVKDGNLKEENFAIDWVKEHYELGLKRIIKDEFGKIKIV